MKQLALVAVLAALLPLPAPHSVCAGDEGTTWNFESDEVNKPPAGFSFGRTGKGPEGRWIVRAARDTPSSGKVLAQVDADSTDYRFPVAVADAPSLEDLRLSVKCRAITGTVDQACGLVFRYQDENNYYVTRANALEDSVNLYYVKDGRRKQFAGWKGKVTAQAWHELSVAAKGDHFQVSFDGKKILEGTDSTFSQAGRVGVWTKADSVTEFDDLAVGPPGAE